MAEFTLFSSAAGPQGHCPLILFALLTVVDRDVDELAKEPAADEIVQPHEDLAQERLADRVVLSLELVEAVKCVAIRVGVEHVDGEDVVHEVHRPEQPLAVREEDLVCLEDDGVGCDALGDLNGIEDNLDRASLLTVNSMMMAAANLDRASLLTVNSMQFLGLV